MHWQTFKPAMFERIKKKQYRKLKNLNLISLVATDPKESLKHPLIFAKQN